MSGRLPPFCFSLSCSMLQYYGPSKVPLMGRSLSFLLQDLCTQCHIIFPPSHLLSPYLSNNMVNTDFFFLGEVFLGLHIAISSPMHSQNIPPTPNPVKLSDDSLSNQAAICLARCCVSSNWQKKNVKEQTNALSETITGLS